MTVEGLGERAPERREPIQDFTNGGWKGRLNGGHLPSKPVTAYR